MSAFVGTGIPLFFAVSGAAIAHLRATPDCLPHARETYARLQARSRSNLGFGRNVFAVTSESWRRTLDHGQTVVGVLGSVLAYGADFSVHRIGA